MYFNEYYVQKMFLLHRYKHILQYRGFQYYQYFDIINW